MGPHPFESLSKTLREAIRTSGKSVYQIAKAANGSQIVISRFPTPAIQITSLRAERLARQAVQHARELK